MDLNEFYKSLESEKGRERLRTMTVSASNALIGDVTICNSSLALVIDIKTYDVGHFIRDKINPPIKDNYIAVAVFTTNGVRWHGIPVR